jgi:ubiquinone/menaquinone biosynthesis C-methylase UbiE
VQHQNSCSHIRERIFCFIPAEAHVLDIGCGTGGFAIKLADHCRHVTGVDISKNKSIWQKKRLAEQKIENVNFIHADGGQFDKLSDQKFDLGVLSFVLHEIDHQCRLSVLSAAINVVSRIIILDYHTPHPESFLGQTTRMIEFVAGKEHFRNFKDYLHGMVLIKL